MKSKKLLSFILTLTMVLSLVPAFTVSAWAAPTGTELTQTSGALATGNYYLSSDLTLTGTLSVAEGQTVTLDLNGYVLNGPGNDCAIFNYVANLTIADSSTDKTNHPHYFKYKKGSAWEYVVSPSETQKQDAIEVNKITSVTSDDQIIVIFGGVITGGYGVGHNGYSDGSAHGGGIANLGGDVTISNVTICGNTSGWHGGGISSCKNTYHSSNASSTLTLNNCMIIGNKSQSVGGGVFDQRGKTTIKDTVVRFNIPDGIAGSGWGDSAFIFSGKNIIKDNINSSGMDCNLYPNGARFSLTSFSAESQIGLSLASYNQLTSTSPKVVSTVSESDFSACFTSDNPEYHVANGTDNAVQIITHPWEYTADGATITAGCTVDGCSANDSLTIAVPEDCIYNGHSKDAVFVDDKNTVGSSTFTADSFTYYLSDGTLTNNANSGASADGKAPVIPGTYYASLAVNTTYAAVTDKFEIVKQNWATKPTVSVEEFKIGKYDSSKNYPTNSAGITDKVTYYLVNQNTNTGGAKWENVNFATLNSGDYYVYAVFEQTAYVEALTTAAYPFKVVHEHNYEYELVAGTNNKILCKCTAESGVCNDAKEIIIKIDNAVYNGQPYVPAGLTQFQKEVENASSIVSISYYDVGYSSNLGAMAPNWAGNFKATLSVGGKTLTDVPFKILQKGIEKPTAGTTEFSYNGALKTFSIVDSVDKSAYTLSDNTATDAGKYTAKVSLNDTTNTCWANDNETGSDPLEFEFTIKPYEIPKPVADPRTFVYNGSEQTFYPFYEIGDSYYCLEGLFYKTTGNKNTAAGDYTASVIPADKNFAWEGGSTAPLTFNYTIAAPTAYGYIYCLYDKIGKSYADGYVYGSYIQDDQNPANLKVSTHFTPYIQTYPSNATYQFYCTTNPYNLNPSKDKKWEDLKYTDIAVNSSMGYGYFYVYAVVKASSYADYVTRPSVVYVYQPNQSVTTNKIISYSVEEKYTQTVMKRNVTKTRTVTKTKDQPVRVRYFNDISLAGVSMLKDLKGMSNGSVNVLWKATGTNNAMGFNATDGARSKIASDFEVSQTLQNLYLASVKSTRRTLGGLLLGATPQKTAAELLAEANLTYAQLIDDFENGVGEAAFHILHYSDLASVKYTQASGSTKMPTTTIDGTDAFQVSQTYTVTFDKLFEEEGGSTVFTTQQVHDGEKVSTPTAPKADGYVFKGWYYIPYNASYTAETVLDLTKDGVLWDFNNDRVYGNLTLYALWDVAPAGGDGGSSSGYAVTVNTTKNGSVAVSSQNASAGSTVTLTVTPDKGYTLETIVVTDKNGKEIELTATKIGKTYTFKMPSGAVTISATFMEDNTMLNYFFDVTAKDYYYDAVLWAAENGITSGKTATTFAPKDTCTRAEFVTFLWRAAGKPVVDYAMPFTDVTGDHYYTEAVRWAASEGIVMGTTATTFNPGGIIDRAQAVAFLYRYSKAPALANMTANGPAPSPFKDVANTSYAYNAVMWAASQGITSGKTTDTFGPRDNCERAHVVVFLYNYFINK